MRIEPPALGTPAANMSHENGSKYAFRPQQVHAHSVTHDRYVQVSGFHSGATASRCKACGALASLLISDRPEAGTCAASCPAPLSVRSTLGLLSLSAAACLLKTQVVHCYIFDLFQLLDCNHNGSWISDSKKKTHICENVNVKTYVCKRRQREYVCHISELVCWLARFVVLGV
jgi:hypothetical protein